MLVPKKHSCIGQDSINHAVASAYNLRENTEEITLVKGILIMYTFATKATS